MTCRVWFLCIPLLLVGCGERPERPVVDVPVTHPANADACPGPNQPMVAETLKLPDPHRDPAPGGDVPHHQIDEPAAMAGDHSESTTQEESSQKVSPTMTTMSGAMDIPRESKNTAPTSQWTCPMHPEIITSAPGRCPKCHMTLVPKKSGTPP